MIAGLLLIFAAASPLTAAEMVTFPGVDQEMITGRLSRPQAHGLSPALVLLHGALEHSAYYEAWADRLSGWGYVTLQLDGYGPPCKSSDSKLPSRSAQCVCDAKSYLAGLPFVDSRRIGLMGWSQKGASALAVYCARSLPGKSEPPFRAGIAFYPYCFKPLGNLDFPLLILIGELDRRAPPALCLDRKKSRQSLNEFHLKIYPGASHYFDLEGMSTDELGYRIQYDQTAASDTILQVREFLEKHLKQ
jgi:dienelactone hydrolase